MYKHHYNVPSRYLNKLRLVQSRGMQLNAIIKGTTEYVTPTTQLLVNTRYGVRGSLVRLVVS